MALTPPQDKAQSHQPQRVAGCGGRASLCDRLSWLDVSVHIDHMYRWWVADAYGGAKEVDLKTRCKALLSICGYCTWRHIRKKTHHCLGDFDCLLEHSPNHCLVAIGGGQGAKVAVILGAIHSMQEVIQWNSRWHWNIVTWGQKHNLWSSWRILFKNIKIHKKRVKYLSTFVCDVG